MHVTSIRTWTGLSATGYPGVALRIQSIEIRLTKIELDRLAAQQPDLTPAEADDTDSLAIYLHELRGLMKSGDIDRLVLLFRDGLVARFGRFDAFRFWRRMSPLL